ncbi:hypothetical protein BGW80DRAFT_1256988 [Lactifluus volemus]|nr:hypothetical protein BGW80DRAFT_1256988 [Lactifluus volemus]
MNGLDTLSGYFRASPGLALLALPVGRQRGQGCRVVLQRQHQGSGRGGGAVAVALGQQKRWWGCSSDEAVVVALGQQQQQWGYSNNGGEAAVIARQWWWRQGSGGSRVAVVTVGQWRWGWGWSSSSSVGAAAPQQQWQGEKAGSTAGNQQRSGSNRGQVVAPTKKTQEVMTGDAQQQRMRDRGGRARLVPGWPGVGPGPADAGSLRARPTTGRPALEGQGQGQAKWGWLWPSPAQPPDSLHMICNILNVVVMHSSH